MNLMMKRSLRIFSRLDEAECKSLNLHDGIDSTLTILGIRLKQTEKHPEIEVVKEYGNLPSVQYYAGLINQREKLRNNTAITSE